MHLIDLKNELHDKKQGVLPLIGFGFVSER